ncbi:flagellar basal body P-ring formation chaperone FlgA [Thalassococcus sp. BH17M4-6]|uniref:flagellar basal body P-ring formation chaperone FlgA n=1 Tax=Thalassococcus sp. BH17M4-6 TaxID=3413148 RepID=UPI003BD08EEE
MRCFALFLALLLPLSVSAETVVALRTIRAQEIVTQDAVTLNHESIDGSYASLDEVIGQEARVSIYPGRPILFGHLGPPAIVDRNQIVELVFERGGLRITSEGRALARGAVGDRVRVMNLSSKTSLFGTVLEGGSIRVAP